MINPLRIVALRLAHLNAREIAPHCSETCAFDFQRFQHQPGKRYAERLPQGLFDDLANEEVADVGISPAVAGLVAKLVGLRAQNHVGC
jgi:hypothetical protein